MNTYIYIYDCYSTLNRECRYYIFSKEWKNDQNTETRFLFFFNYETTKTAIAALRTCII